MQTVLLTLVLDIVGGILASDRSSLLVEASWLLHWLRIPNLSLLGRLPRNPDPARGLLG